MSNARLSIPELEDQIAALTAEVRSRRSREGVPHWYVCTRCSSIYTSIWGCGCVTEQNLATIKELRTALEAKG